MPKFDKQSILEPSHGIFSFSAAACTNPTSSLYCVVQLPQDWPSLAAEHPDMDIRVLESAYGHLDWAVSKRSWMSWLLLRQVSFMMILNCPPSA